MEQQLLAAGELTVLKVVQLGLMTLYQTKVGWAGRVPGVCAKQAQSRARADLR